MSNDNNNQKNPLDAASTTASELNEMNTMADSKPRPDEEIAERDVLTDFTYPVNFKKTEGFEIDGATLVLKYEWEPASGITAHLGACQIYQTVVHPAEAPLDVDKPPMKALGYKIVDVKNIAASDRSFTFAHGNNGFTNTPSLYTPLDFTTTVSFSWRQMFWSPNIDNVDMWGGESFKVRRQAYQQGSRWMYECSEGDSVAIMVIPGTAAAKYEQIRDIEPIMKTIASIQVGTTRAELEKHFVLCNTQDNLTRQRYLMKDCPHIVMDVTFEFVDPAHPFDGQDRITDFAKYGIDSPKSRK